MPFTMRNGGAFLGLASVIVAPASLRNADPVSSGDNLGIVSFFGRNQSNSLSFLRHNSRFMLSLMQMAG